MQTQPRTLALTLSHKNTVRLIKTVWGAAVAGRDLNNQKLDALRAMIADSLAAYPTLAPRLDAEAAALAAEALPAPALPAPLPAPALPAIPTLIPAPAPQVYANPAETAQAAALAAEAAQALGCTAEAARLAALSQAAAAQAAEAPAPDVLDLGALAALPAGGFAPPEAPAPAAPPVYVGRNALDVAALPTAAPAAPFRAPSPFAPPQAPAPIPAAVLSPASVPVPAAPIPDAQGRTLRLAAEVFAHQPDLAQALPPGLLVPCYADPEAPARDGTYVFDALVLSQALIAMAAAPCLPVWAGGPKGSGKTEFARQLAAYTGRALYRVSFNRATEPADVLGDLGVARDGSTQWADGPITMALRRPGSILLLDEITYAAQGYLASLNGLLEGTGAAVRLPRTGEAVTMADGVFIIAADNTYGHGDTSGEYIGRGRMSADTLDRFPVKLAFAYPEAAIEARLLRTYCERRTGRKLRATTSRAIIATCATARAKGAAGELQGAPGLRAALAWAILLTAGQDPAQAYTATVVRAAPEESQETLRAIFAATWPASDADVAAAVEA